MQGEYPANGDVRLRHVCGDGQAEPRSGRLFVCPRCREQAIVCRCCDRGQIYCGAECARQAREEAQHAAAKRYAESPRGKRRQADRSRRYRGRQREIVTHQGSPASPAGDLLPADAMAIPRDDVFPADLPRRSMAHCHWCGHPCLPQLRQSFLRRRDRRRGRVGRTRTEHNAPW